MPVSVTMPRLGESVTEGTVTRWLKQEGERVEVDEPLLEVSTDKVDTEIPSPAAGVLSRIVVSEDETAEVGSELAVIAGDGDSDGQAASDGSADETPHAQSAPAQSAPAESADAESADAESAKAQSAPAESADAESAEAEPAQAASAEATPEAETEPVSVPAEASPNGATGSGAAAAQSSAAPESSADQPPSGGGSGGGTVVRMPALGESVTEGTVTRWLKQIGDQVEADEPLLEVSTDKVDTEIPSPAAGTLVSISVEQDDTAAVGAELAVIGGAGDAAAAPAESTPGASYGSPAPEVEQSEQPTQTEQAAQPPAPTEQPAAAAQPAQAQPAQAQPAPAQPAPAQSAPAQSAPAQSAPAQSAPAQSASAQSAPAQSAGAKPAAAGPAGAEPGSTAGGDDGGYVTPLVRKLAGERGVDLSTVTGTGVGGRIRKQDVIEAADRAKAAAAAAAKPATAPAGATPEAKPAASPLRGRTEKLTRTRATIARRMVESLQTTAQLTTVVEVDVTRIARLRNQAKVDFQTRNGVKLSFMPFFALAAVEALRTHPVVNASIDQEAGTVTYHDGEHLGIAVDTAKGLIVPVIRDAGEFNLAGLAKRIADVAERTRTNKISPDELSGGTFTLTNTGSRGALFDTPIFTPPQVAILGTGAVVKRAVVVEDPDLGELILPRSMVYLALSYDHRLVDGADAARFLTTIKERLEAGRFEGELGLTG